MEYNQKMLQFSYLGNPVQDHSAGGGKLQWYTENDVIGKN